ncbi:MAG: hypothetical protein QNJ70_06475 [Xenococcaceae cyanobacterium MO_207.B15]|nr:hypothetical protein [Xenococcaceae cyanobacterium MO_207.B15]
MNSKRNEWKVLQLFVVAAIANLFTYTVSQATLVKAQKIAEPTIENRLAKVRERFKQIRRESGTLSSWQNSLETEKDKTIQAQQWPNYWNDWSNWSNWSNAPWSNWSNAPWSNAPWSNAPWSNWGNY